MPIGWRAGLVGSALLALTACGGHERVSPTPVWDGWYQNLAEPTAVPRYLWRELAPIGQAQPEGEYVHLRRLGDGYLQLSLYRQARCVARMELQGEWREQAFFHKQSYFSGLPPLAWGRQSREAQVRVRDDHLQMQLHESSFGMFLIIAGGAPDHEASYRFDAVAAPAAHDDGCPPSTASADGYR